MHGQPAHGEHEDDNDYHVRDASFIAHALRRATPAWRGPVEEPSKQTAVQDTDGREREHVAEREETAVEDPTLARTVLVDVVVETRRADLADELVRDVLVIVQHRHVQRHYDCPEYGDDDVSVAFGAVRHGADGVNDCEVAIDGHQDESVDAPVGRHVQGVLVDLAEYIPERPYRRGVRHGREGNAHDDEEQVGDGQVDYEDVGCVTHLSIGHHDDDDEQIPEEAEHRDKSERHRDGNADDGLEVSHSRDELFIERRAAVGAVTSLVPSETIVRRYRAHVHSGHWR